MHVVAVIPAFKVASSILEVIRGLGEEVDRIIVVDDACPDLSGKVVENSLEDDRLIVLYHSQNQGVGGAMITGYQKALEIGADVVVKVDGDGQMDTTLIPDLIRPIVEGEADYVKGNRFDTLEDLIQMPKVRVFGNAFLSLFSKLSTGYWSVNDPTNGFTAISAQALRSIRLQKVRKSYFFESDMLFRLAISRARILDFAMAARYGSEKSNLRIGRVLIEFPWRHLVNFVKRILYKYYLREWSIASFELPTGVALFTFGLWFGLASFVSAASEGRAATAGQATISAVGIILGIQFLLSFLSYDIQSEPQTARSKKDLA